MNSYALLLTFLERFRERRSLPFPGGASGHSSPGAAARPRALRVVDCPAAYNGNTRSQPEAGSDVHPELPGVAREREAWQSAGRSLAARGRHPHSARCTRLSHRRAAQAYVLCRSAEVLSGAGGGVASRADRNDWTLGRRTRTRGGVDLVRSEHAAPRAEPEKLGADRRSARHERSAGEGRAGRHEAALSPDGRIAQRRNRSVGNVDGVGVSPGHGNVAADQPDP